MISKVLSQNFLFRLIFSFGILIGFSVLILTTLQDSKDLERIVSYNTPEIFSTDLRFNSVKNKIIDRPLYMDPDSYNWVYNATTMVKNHLLRIRFTDSDNAPYGRDVHWSNAYAWYLIILGNSYSLLTGDEIISSIEKAGRFANAILIAFFGLFWAIVLVRKFNTMIAMLFPLILFLFGAIRPEITFGFADHHALHMLLAMSQMLAITLAGVGFITVSPIVPSNSSIFSFFEPTSYTEARTWFIIAAFFGACGLSVGATQQAIIIGLIGSACTIATLFWKYKSTQYKSILVFTPSPELWRWWGFCGASLSLIFYLFEYFPSHLGMQLEINHPLYAIAWAGGAEIIYRICLLTTPERPKDQKYVHLKAIALGTFAVFLLPIAILFGPDTWHFIHDGITTRTHDFILEFARIYDPILGVNFQYFLFKFGMYPASIIFAFLFLSLKKTDFYHKILLLYALIISLVLLIAFIIQERWTSFFSIALIVLFVTLTSSVFKFYSAEKENQNSLRVTALFLALFLSSQWFYQIHLLYFQTDEKSRFMRRYFTLPLILLSREIAINLEYLAPENKHSIICDNSFSPMLSYFGVGNSVGSLYWENAEGLHDQALFWSAYTDEEAYEIIKQRGITHVSLQIDSEKLAKQSQWIFRGSKNEDDIKRTFAYRLAYNPLNHPSWLEPFPLFYANQSKDEKIAFYKVKER